MIKIYLLFRYNMMETLVIHGFRENYNFFCGIGKTILRKSMGVFETKKCKIAAIDGILSSKKARGKIIFRMVKYYRDKTRFGLSTDTRRLLRSFYFYQMNLFSQHSSSKLLVLHWCFCFIFCFFLCCCFLLCFFFFFCGFENPPEGLPRFRRMGRTSLEFF